MQPPLMPEDLKSAEFLKLATPSSLGRGLMLPTERLPAHDMRNFGLLHDSYPLSEQVPYLPGNPANPTIAACLHKVTLCGQLHLLLPK